MKHCPACNEQIKDDALRCKHCGKNLPVKKCPWCAEIIDETAEKCRHCKSYLTKIRCGGCSRHTEVAEMRCEECVSDVLQAEIGDFLEKEVWKDKLKNTVIVVLAVLLLATWFW